MDYRLARELQKVMMLADTRSQTSKQRGQRPAQAAQQRTHPQSLRPPDIQAPGRSTARADAGERRGLAGYELRAGDGVRIISRLRDQKIRGLTAPIVGQTAAPKHKLRRVKGRRPHINLVGQGELTVTVGVIGSGGAVVA